MEIICITIQISHNPQNFCEPESLRFQCMRTNKSKQSQIQNLDTFSENLTSDEYVSKLILLPEGNQNCRNGEEVSPMINNGRRPKRLIEVGTPT